MTESATRGKGRWREGLWRSHDLLKSLGLPVLNFEGHVPMVFRKRWVMDAYCDLKDFATPDRYFGLVGNTEILNHAHARHGLDLTRISEEDSRFGFWRTPPERRDVEAAAEGKTFFNFDDGAFSEGIRAFLKGRFRRKSKYEK